MPRPPRITYPGAIHHAMARANDQRHLFVDDDDRHAFLELMAIIKDTFEVEWRMFTLMNTHFHAKVRTPHPNVSAAMQYLLSKFAQGWNRRRGGHGPLLDARFLAPLIEDSEYALNVVRYIALNPVTANYVAHAGEWPWSSHQALAGLESPPEFLDVEWLRNCFDGPTLRECQLQYRHYIDGTETHPIEELDPILTGSDALAEEVRSFIGRKMHGVIVPRAYRALARPTLAQLFSDFDDDLEGRNRTIIRAQVVHGYTQSEIARSLDLHPNTISKITTTIRRRRRSLMLVT